MTTHPHTPPAAALKGHAGLELIPVRERLWRVTRVGGAVLGHIEAVSEASGDRYQARRQLPGGLASGKFNTLDLGTFWRADDAVDCFRS